MIALACLLLRCSITERRAFESADAIEPIVLKPKIKQIKLIQDHPLKLLFFENCFFENYCILMGPNSHFKKTEWLNLHIILKHDEEKV